MLSCLINSVAKAAEEIETGQPAPFGGAIITDEELGKVLLVIQKLPILESEKENLTQQITNLKSTWLNAGDQVVNLKQQIELYKQLLQIAGEREKLEKDRAEFYKDQGIAKDKTIEQLNQVIDKLAKETEKKGFWKALAAGAIGTAIGILIAALIL